MGERKLLAERSGFFIEVFCSPIAQMEDEIKGGLNIPFGTQAGQLSITRQLSSWARRAAVLQKDGHK